MARITGSVVSRREALARAGAAGLLAACGAPAGDSAAEAGVAGVDASAPEPIAAITPNADFYVTSCCGTPEVDGTRWVLTVRAKEAVATIGLAGLEALGARDREHTLECIGANPYNAAIGNAVWSGLPLVEVLAALGVTVPAGTVELVFSGADDYTTSIPIADLDLPVWLVWRMNGAPLPPEHGYPARLLVPGRYGMKNPKWIVEIAFSDEPYTGFWESYGWSNDAAYRANTLVLAPERRAVVEAGPVRVQGTAFAGSDPVVRVEVCVDGGEWTEATIDYAPGADVWTLWHHDWEAAAGSHRVQVRCTTASGAASLPDPEGSDGLEGYDGSMEIELEAV